MPMLSTDVPNMMGSWYTIQIDNHVQCGKYPGKLQIQLANGCYDCLTENIFKRDLFGNNKKFVSKDYGLSQVTHAKLSLSQGKNEL